MPFWLIEAKLKTVIPSVLFKKRAWLSELPDGNQPNNACLKYPQVKNQVYNLETLVKFVFQFFRHDWFEKETEANLANGFRQQSKNEMWRFSQLKKWHLSAVGGNEARISAVVGNNQWYDTLACRATSQKIHIGAILSSTPSMTLKFISGLRLG